MHMLGTIRMQTYFQISLQQDHQRAAMLSVMSDTLPCMPKSLFCQRHRRTTAQTGHPPLLLLLKGPVPAMLESLFEKLILRAQSVGFIPFVADAEGMGSAVWRKGQGHWLACQVL